MADQKNNNALKILTGVLAVALVALGIYTVKFYNEEKDNREILLQEKAVIEGELNELIVRYDEAIAENEGMDTELVAARERITALRDSVQDMEANLAVLNRYRNEVNNLKLEKERLFRVVDSLSNENSRLITEIDSTNNILFERTRRADSLQASNLNLENKVDMAAQLKLSGLRGEGVIERNSGRLIVNNRTRRVDKIRTCFTMTTNALAEAGEKEIYVQVYNPNNELVGDQIAVQHEGGVMVYSAATKVFYENEELDVCVLANTLSDKLIEGTYQLVALNDLNNNYKFDPEREKIAFLEETVTVPSDSLYELRLFREIQEFNIARPKQVAEQHLIFGYTGIVDPDSLQIDMYPVPEDFEHRITLDREKDTLHYWYKPLLERDTLKFLVEAPYQDSLLTRRSEMDQDSLQIAFQPSGTLNFNQDLQILPSLPLNSTVDSLITLFDQDTLAVPFTLEYDEFRNRVLMDFQMEESQRYNLQALPGAFVDFFGNTNDTIRSQFRTQTFADYGNVVVNLVNVKEYPIIVQLTNENGEVQAEKESTGGTSFNFNNLKPAPYFIRVIYDTNGNGIWDTGSYLGKLQPEEVVYFPEPLDVRANWDVTQLFDLNFDYPAPAPEEL